MSKSTQANIPTSHTLWSPHDTIKDVADTLGITSQWNEEVAKNLAMDVEYRIYEIIEQATKFMRHGKRKVLTTQDIDRAMKVLNLEPLYGYDTSKPPVFKEAMIGPGQTLYYIEDDEVDFETLINQPLPPVPRFTTCTAHWLAVEGVQPTIPQNPNLNDIRSLPPIQRGTLDNMLSLNNEDITLATNPKTGITSVDKSNHDKKDLDVKPLVKHVLSKELQLYFNKCIEVLTNDSLDQSSLRIAALESIKNDPGLHQLVPYFIQFIAETTTHNLKNIKLLKIMLQLIYSLLNNTTLFLDPYIHALMPCILTLLLAKSLGSNNDDDEHSNNEHYQFRDLSKDLLKQIVETYSSSYNTLKPRITRTLIKALLSNTTKTSLGTQYGALLGLKCLGTEVIRIILIGNLKNWYQTVILEIDDDNNEGKEKLILKVFECLNLLADESQLVKSNQKRKIDDVDVDIKEDITDEMKNKLNERVGEDLANKIWEQKNGIAIYNGIFLGEI